MTTEITETLLSLRQVARELEAIAQELHERWEDGGRTDDELLAIRRRIAAIERAVSGLDEASRRGY